ncbi:MAG: hypothetical protein R3C99_10535 [Pirellulaceae bacterium]
MASIDVTDSLRILRVRPDTAIGGYEAGQYTSLGLGYWEARVPEADMESLDERRLAGWCVGRTRPCSMIREEARPASTHAGQAKARREPKCDWHEYRTATSLNSM